MLAKEILKSSGECFISLLISGSLVFVIAILWKADEFIGAAPLPLVWSWQAMIIAVIVSSLFSVTKLWIKQRSRLPLQLACSVCVAITLTLFTQVGSTLAPHPEILALKTSESVEPPTPQELPISHFSSIENDEPQNLPDEL